MLIRTWGYCHATTVSHKTLGFTCIIDIFIFLRSVPETQSAHEWDLKLVSGAIVWRNLHYFCEPGPFPGLPGACRGPQGPKIGRKNRGRIYHLSSPRSAQFRTRSIPSALTRRLGWRSVCCLHVQSTLRQKLSRTYIRKLKSRFLFWSVWGRFPAKVGPGTVSNGPCLENAT